MEDVKAQVFGGSQQNWMQSFRQQNPAPLGGKEQ